VKNPQIFCFDCCKFGGNYRQIFLEKENKKNENPNETMVVKTVRDFALSNHAQNPIVSSTEMTLR